MYLFLAALVALGAMLSIAGQLKAQDKPTGKAPANPTDKGGESGRVAVFNITQIMKDYSKWQYFSTTVANEAKKAEGELIKLKINLTRMTEQAEKEPVQERRDALVKAIREGRNGLEDRQKQLKEQIEAKLVAHMKELFKNIQEVAQSVAESGNYDIVLTYPEGSTQQELDSPGLIELKMRPTAAMPFYVNKRIDVTEVMLVTLNKFRPAPGEIPAPLVLDPQGNLTAGAVTPTSATAPAK